MLPVNSATSASTLRFTRYARDSRAAAAMPACRRCCDKPGRQQCLHALRELSDVGARRCAQVDARQPAAQSERILDGGDVHHRVTQRPAAARRTGDAQRQRRAARCDVDGVAIVNAQPACCGRAGKQRVASQRIHPVPRCADERRRDRSRAKHVDAYERQRRVATAHRDIGFDDGARDGDAVEPREQRIECLVEAGARPAHLEIGISGKRRKSRRKLVHRGTIDELDGVAERDTERDRNDGEQRAPADERAHAARDGACDGERRAERAHVSRHRRFAPPRVRRVSVARCDPRTPLRLRECVASTQAAPLVVTASRSSLITCAAYRRIEVAGRLVGEHQRRAVDERAGDRHALQFAARKLARLAALASGKTHAFQHRGDALAFRGRRFRRAAQAAGRRFPQPTGMAARGTPGTRTPCGPVATR